MTLRYELSPDADQDVEAIYDYTAEKFGAAQAMSYLAGIDEILGQLVRNPELGRDRAEIKPGLRSVVHESHTIFYRILSDRLRIVRIMHGSRDVLRAQID